MSPMIDIKDIEKLAQLSRMAVPEGEKEKLQKDLASILDYVSELGSAPAPEGEIPEPYVKNVMREDANPYGPGEFTDEILAEAPNRAGNYFKVKKIFG